MEKAFLLIVIVNNYTFHYSQSVKESVRFYKFLTASSHYNIDFISNIF